MKNLKIQVPEGYEIDKEKSTFDNIILKKIEKKRPMSVKEIEGREWFISGGGGFITKAENRFDDLNNVSTKERAEAFLALMQLVELRDAWNGGGIAKYKERYIIYVRHNEPIVFLQPLTGTSRVLEFRTCELAKEFYDQFKDLIETAKELI